MFLRRERALLLSVREVEDWLFCCLFFCFRVIMSSEKTSLALVSISNTTAVVLFLRGGASAVAVAEAVAVAVVSLASIMWTPQNVHATLSALISKSLCSFELNTCSMSA